MKLGSGNKGHLKKEFIKSGAILLLAVILLVSAVLAWFADNKSTDVAAFYLSVKNEQGEMELGQNIKTPNSIVLPCATKIDDPEMSVTAVSKALKVIPLDVESSKFENVEIVVKVPNGIHFYIDLDYDAGDDTAVKYADSIIGGLDNDPSKKELEYVATDYDTVNKVYRHMVAIVFWADYDTLGGSIEGLAVGEEIRFNANMSFKNVNKSGEE